MRNVNKFSWTRFIYSILLNSAVLVIALVVFKPFFEEIDDTHISMILEGAYGTKQCHTVFTNTLLGQFIVLMQTILPNIRWFIVFQYVFIYLGYVISVYAISKHKRGWFISAIIVLSTSYEMYVSVQYTKTTAFVCTAGYIALLEYVRDLDVFDKSNKLTVFEIDPSLKKEGRMLLIIGWILIFYGIILRRDGLFLAAVPTAAVGLLELLRTKNIKRYLIAFVPVAAMFVLLHFYNAYTYSSNPEWKDVPEYNTARTVLNDQRCDALDYSTYGDELSAVGVSENDALVLLTYQFGDDDVFSIERMEEIVCSFAPKKLVYTTFANLFENLVGELSRSYTMLAGLIGILIILIASIITDKSKSSPSYIRDARLKRLAMVIIGIICGAAFVYFQYMGRYSHRLAAAVVIPTIFVISYMIDGINLKDNDSKIVFGGNRGDITAFAVAVFSLILIGLNVLLYFNNQKDFQLWQTEEAPKLEALDELLSDKNSYYVADTFTMQNIDKYALFDVYEEGYFDNYVTTGSWFLNTPITKETMVKYGYSNPYKALRDVDGNVYLIDNLWLEGKMTFLNEHYDGTYAIGTVNNIGGLNIYKLNWTE